MNAALQTMSPLRVAVVADLAEERWPSMDLVADMLTTHLAKTSTDTGIVASLLRPTLKPRGEGLGRFVNRFWDYARWLRTHADNYDLFHVVDHSYAHLVHVLPAQRTVVTCHDVDAFLSIADPALTQSRLPTSVVRVLLSGLRRAARVTCDSRATFDDLTRYGLVPANRLHVVPNGTHELFSPVPDGHADAIINGLLGRGAAGGLDLLHVGTTIPRKRIDLLLRIVAAVRKHEPRVRLVKAGGALTAEQKDLAASLGLTDHVLQLPSLDTAVLAALYRGSALVLLTSDREGFGLPIVEALASGTPIVATDLPVLREVGGNAARYCPLEDVGAWRDEILRCLRRRDEPHELEKWRTAALAQSRLFSWEAYAASMTHVYRGMWSGREWHVGAQRTCANGF